MAGAVGPESGPGPLLAPGRAGERLCRSELCGHRAPARPGRGHGGGNRGRAASSQRPRLSSRPRRYRLGPLRSRCRCLAAAPAALRLPSPERGERGSGSVSPRSCLRTAPGDGELGRINN